MAKKLHKPLSSRKGRLDPNALLKKQTVLKYGQGKRGAQKIVLSDEDAARRASDMIALETAILELVGYRDQRRERKLHRWKQAVLGYRSRHPEFRPTSRNEVLTDTLQSQIARFASLPATDKAFVVRELLSDPSRIAEETIQLFEKLGFLGYPEDVNHSDQDNQNELVSNFHERTNPARGSEDARSNKRIQLRISEQLKSRMDDAAMEDGLDRSAWFEEQAWGFLNSDIDASLEEYPDYRTTGVVNLRVSSELYEQFTKAADDLCIKKADFSRRVIFHALARRVLNPAPRFTL